MSGNDERPILPLLEECRACGETQSPNELYYTIYDYYDQIIGYFNSQRAILEGEYTCSLDIHTAFKTHPKEDFIRAISYIKCPHCLRKFAAGSTEWPIWLRRIEQAFRLKDYKYDESMYYNLIM